MTRFSTRPVARDQHHQGAAGAEGHELDVAQRRLALGRDDEAGAPGEAGQHLPRLGHGFLAASGHGRRSGR
jgi:hypothetical protein